MRELLFGQVIPSDLVKIDAQNRVLSLQTDRLQDTGLHDMLLCVTLPKFNVEYC